MKKVIPIYFAIDDNYAPYLVVTLQSIMENRSQDYFYKFHILNQYLSERNATEMAKFNTENTSVEFIDVQKYMDNFQGKLHLRDYYTNATYYRMFLPTIAKEHDKILYLDSDIVVLGDIADLYNHEIGDNLVGAITEDVMTNFEVFGNYVEKAIGVNRFKYFNAGILVMNTKQFREMDIENKFMELIQAFKFELVQDEDYLNALCKGRVQYLDEGWNRAPVPGTELPREKLNLVHYKIAWKPWKYADVMYQDYFWQYAANTAYNDELLEARANYAGAADDQWQFENLVKVANRDAESKENFNNTTGADKHEVYNGIKPQ